jgi:Ribbon-helix-helix protein, copG family
MAESKISSQPLPTASVGPQVDHTDCFRPLHDYSTQALETQAKKQGVSMGELVRRALDAYLKLKAEK